METVWWSQESVARQHQMAMYKMPLDIKKKKREKAEQRIKWGKLRKEEYCANFKEFRKAQRKCLMDR